MLPRTPQKKATWHYPFYLYLGYAPQFGRFISSQNSNYSSLPNFKSNVQRRNPAQTMLIVQNRANNSSSMSRTLGLHLHLKRWAATEMVDYGCSWYTRHGNQLRWLSVCVCVILSYDWTNVVTGWNGNWLQCAVITMTITGLLIIYAQKVGTSSSVIGRCDSSMLQPAAISIS